MKLNVSKLRGRLTKKSNIAAIAIIILVFLVPWFMYSREQNKQSGTKSAEPLITVSTDKPSESKEEAQNYNWRGSDTEPMKIRIARLGVDSFIQKAGVDQNKQVAVPNNIHLASWFADSRQPGQTGLSIIDGHVSGPTADGVFKNIKKLVKGDSFEVELGSGKILSYSVIETVELKESESASYLFSQQPDVSSQLNLITCGGKFDKAANQFENRVIVAAKLKN